MIIRKLIPNLIKQVTAEYAKSNNTQGKINENTSKLKGSSTVEDELVELQCDEQKEAKKNTTKEVEKQDAGCEAEKIANQIIKNWFSGSIVDKAVETIEKARYENAVEASGIHAGTVKISDKTNEENTKILIGKIKRKDTDDEQKEAKKNTLKKSYVNKTWAAMLKTIKSKIEDETNP